MRSSCTRGVDLVGNRRSSGGSRSKSPFVQVSMRKTLFSGGTSSRSLIEREVDDALAQVDLADVVVGADDEHAALLRRAEELEQVGQRDLLDRSRSSCASGAPRPAPASRARRWRRAPSGVDAAITLRMLVPMRTRSPSFRRGALDLLAVDEGAVGGAEVLDPDLVVLHAMRACWRETMSSTSTMSRSLERPMTISLVVPSGNSPPWYLPRMKRKRELARAAAAAWGRGLSIVGERRPAAVMHARSIRVAGQRGAVSARRTLRQESGAERHVEVPAARRAVVKLRGDVNGARARRRPVRDPPRARARGGPPAARRARSTTTSRDRLRERDRSSTSRRSTSTPRASARWRRRAGGDPSAVGAPGAARRCAAAASSTTRSPARAGCCSGACVQRAATRADGPRLRAGRPRRDPRLAVAHAALADARSARCGPRRAQLDVEGDGRTSSRRRRYAKMPADMPERLALAVLDVAGAAPQVARLVRPGRDGRRPRRGRQERAALRGRGAPARGRRRHASSASRPRPRFADDLARARPLRRTSSSSTRAIPLAVRDAVLAAHGRPRGRPHALVRQRARRRAGAPSSPRATAARSTSSRCRRASPRPRSAPRASAGTSISSSATATRTVTPSTPWPCVRGDKALAALLDVTLRLKRCDDHAPCRGR